MTEEKMDQMKTLVKDLARSKCKEQLVKYKQRLATIAQKPTHLKDFAGYVLYGDNSCLTREYWRPISMCVALYLCSR